MYTKERFRDVTGSPAWAGALFDGRIKVPAGGVTEKTELLEQVLFYEYNARRRKEARRRARPDAAARRACST